MKNKTLFKNALLYFSIIGVMFLMLAGTFAADKSDNPSRWMANIKGNTRICDINIPGTHESATSKVPLVTSLWLKCQSDSISTQLIKGIRYLDLRIDGKGVINHEGFDCWKGVFKKLYFVDVVKDVERFLKNNPTETVILQIKSEGGKTSCDSYVNRLLSESKYFYSPSNKNLKSLVLEDVRGKFIVFTRDSNVNGYKFSSWPDNRIFSSNLNDLGIYVQDKYDVDKNCDEKIQQIESFYETAWKNDLKQNGMFINFISFAGKPSKNADKISSFITRYLSENCNKKLGIVLFDFPSDVNIKNVYKNGHLTK